MTGARNSRADDAKTNGGLGTRGCPVELLGVAAGAMDRPTVLLVEDVAWRVEAGSLQVVLAAPVAAANALLETAATLAPPLQGECRLFGRDPARVTKAEAARLRLRVGYVFAGQGRLFEQLTAAQNVALPLQYHSNQGSEVVTAEVRALLEAVGIGRIGLDYPAGLAFAERRRVALARALALRPEVLFLDTPLAGLSRPEAAWWVRFLSRLASGDAPVAEPPVAVVVSDDDPRPWLKVAQRFSLIRQRRLSELEVCHGSDGTGGEWLDAWLSEAEAALAV